jgi:hypothetical protein
MVVRSVNIISDYSTAMRFRALSNYELDLGKRNLVQQGKESVMKISDEFVNFVFREYGFLINKIGRYGSITFYYSNYSEKDKIYIFFDKIENEVTIPMDVTNQNLEKWLSLTLYEIQEKNKNLTNASN